MKNCPICSKEIVAGRDILLLKWYPAKKWWVTEHLKRITDEQAAKDAGAVFKLFGGDNELGHYKRFCGQANIHGVLPVEDLPYTKARNKLVHDAAKATEYFTEDELEEHAANLKTVDFRCPKCDKDVCNSIVPDLSIIRKVDMRIIEPHRKCVQCGSKIKVSPTPTTLGSLTYYYFTSGSK